MKTGCEEFRTELESALADGGTGLGRLASQAHPLACAACRRWIEREQRLEGWLARGEEVPIPPGLPRRVLDALADARRSGAARASSARGVLDEGELETLLGRVPPARVPPGLALRILRGLVPARAPHRPGVGARRWLAAAACAALVGFVLWVAQGRPPEGPREDSGTRSPLVQNRVDPHQVPQDEGESDEELLAYAVERWELLNEDDLDLWLASLDPVDEFLMEHSDGKPLDADDDAGAAAPQRE